MKTKILGTGLSGLVGTRVTELLSEKYEFEDLSLDTGVDITNRNSVYTRVRESQANWILHMAAKADVDGCETDKSADKHGAAWMVNVEGTRNIVEAARELGKKVLYISTDFVFDGMQDAYSEDDTPRPVNWYGHTKLAGEKIVAAAPANIIVRIAYPYRAKNPTKPDFLHAILEKLKAGDEIKVLTDHIITPTFIDDIARAFDLLLAKNAKGIYHVAGSSFVTPYEAAGMIAGQFGFERGLIVGTTINEYYKNRAPRPLQLRIKNAKISTLGVSMVTFADGLRNVVQQGVFQ